MKDIYQIGRPRNGPPFDEYLDEKDLKILIDSLCHNNKGTILYEEFISFALDHETSDETIEVHAKLQKEIFKRTKLRLKDFIKLFSVSKTYGKGYVRNSEFQNVLRKVSSKISVKDVDILTTYWDVEKEGTIDFHAFAVWLHTGNVPEEVRSDSLTSVIFYFRILSTIICHISFLIFTFSLPFPPSFSFFFYR